VVVQRKGVHPGPLVVLVDASVVVLMGVQKGDLMEFQMEDQRGDPMEVLSSLELEEMVHLLEGLSEKMALKVGQMVVLLEILMEDQMGAQRVAQMVDPLADASLEASALEVHLVEPPFAVEVLPWEGVDLVVQISACSSSVGSYLVSLEDHLVAFLVEDMTFPSSN